MRTILIIISTLFLSGCGTITQKAEQTVAGCIQSNTSHNSYPAAFAKSSQLYATPPTIDLSQYQSVQSPLGRPHQRPDLAIAVAASGGGYRAANLTAGVLMGLEQITDPHLYGNLLEEVDYFSTVSGGGFGVGYYLASLYDFMQLHGSGPFIPQFSFTNTMNQIPAVNPLDKDYRGDLFGADDRGAKIEQSLAMNILHTQNGTLNLGDIFVPANGDPAKVTLPYWATNSTVFQNAALFPFTPDVLKQYGVNSYIYNGKSVPVNNPYDIPAAVGMAASASFPFALSPTTLGSTACSNGNCYVQLVDGGLSDNLGVYTALNLLQQDAAKTKVLIVIDAYAGDEQPFSQSEAPPSGATLLWKVMGMGVDASRQNLKRNINQLAHDELCSHGAKNVVVIYLDLEHYDRARAISTGLFITHKQQKLLVDVGQNLVRDNPEFNQLLKPLLDGNMSIGSCTS